MKLLAYFFRFLPKTKKSNTLEDIRAVLPLWIITVIKAKCLDSESQQSNGSGNASRVLSGLSQ